MNSTVWNFKLLPKLLLALIPASASVAGLYYTYMGNLFEQEGFWLTNTLLDSNWKNRGDLKAYKSKITKIPNKYSHIQKTSHLSNGLESIETISDYTLKIETPCGSGTGWFLDYVIPENSKYPTTWFIATNAHIVNDFWFKSNPYNQTLPKPLSKYSYSDTFERDWGNILNCYDSRRTQYSNLKLYKQGFTVGEEYNGEVSSNLYNKGRELNTYLYPHGYYDWENVIKTLASGAPIVDVDSRINSGIRRSVYYDNRYYEQPYIYRAVIKDPKLVYAPINFSGPRFNKNGSYKWYDHYYKDFVVLEVNFSSESAARRITDNFYTKYKTVKKDKEINFFTDELMNRFTGDELIDSEENYYIAGFPANQLNSYKLFSNLNTKYGTVVSRLAPWNETRYSSEGLDDLAIKNEDGDKIIGHVDAGKIDYMFRNTTTYWNGKHHTSWGYNYILNNVTLHGGASGSLVLNSKRDLLGVYRMHDAANSIGFVEPLNSVGLIKDKQIILPRYDVLRGSEGQISSYKQQLETYFKNKKTHLKDELQWESPKRNEPLVNG